MRVDSNSNGLWDPDFSVSARRRPGSGDAAADPPDAPKNSSGTKTLTPGEQDQVRKLRDRDREVHAHEAAHQAAAGAHGGGASFSYETGPDGKRYAVGGEVPVQLQPGRTPAETIRNAQQVRAAALAPAEPSSQDMAVAAQAAQMEAAARSQEADDHQQGDAGKASSDGTNPGSGSRDPHMMLSRLASERKVANGGGSHPHGQGEGGCAICARSVAMYSPVSATTG